MTSGVSAVLGNAGEGHAIEHKGRKYTGRLVVQKIKGQIERALQAKARREVCEMAALLPPAQAGAAVAAHTEKVLAGEYAFTAKRCQELLGSAEGAILLASVLFSTDEDTITEMLLDPVKGQEVLAILQQITAESFPPNA